MVHPDSRRVPRVPRYLGIQQEKPSFHLRDSHPLWSAIQCCSIKMIFCNSLKTASRLQLNPATPQRQRTCPLTSLRFRLFPVRSPLLRKSRLISFPPGTEMVHFPGFASRKAGFFDITRKGFPHSGISGSKLAYSSPKLIAVRRALLRLSVPRHPPYTLSTLIITFNFLFSVNLTQQNQ